MEFRQILSGAVLWIVGGIGMFGVGIFGVFKFTDWVRYASIAVAIAGVGVAIVAFAHVWRLFHWY